MCRFILPAMLLAAAALLTAQVSGAEDKDKQARPTAVIGQPAPLFSLADQDGQKVHLSDYKGKIVVLEWINPECPFVVRHYNEQTMTGLAEQYAEHEVVWLAIDSSYDLEDQRSRDWIERYDVGYPILNDASGDVGRAYNAQTTPQMYIIDAEGVLVYNGGIDDDPRGRNDREERANYVADALAEIVNGGSITVAESRPYGCTVKYAN